MNKYLIKKNKGGFSVRINNVVYFAPSLKSANSLVKIHKSMWFEWTTSLKEI